MVSKSALGGYMPYADRLDLAPLFAFNLNFVGTSRLRHSEYFQIINTHHFRHDLKPEQRVQVPLKSSRNQVHYVLCSNMPAKTITGPLIGVPKKKRFTQQLACKLYTIARQHSEILSDEKTTSEGAKRSPITLVCISDTHNTTPSLPEGDILLHAGDLSQYGTFAEIQAQLTWLAAQPHEHKIIIAGNHDLLLDTSFVTAHPDRELDKFPGSRRGDLAWGDVRYLEHEAIDLVVKDRNVRVFGSPWTPRFGNFSFQYGDQDKQWAGWAGAIPPETDIFLTHGPPAMHLDDDGKGCKELLSELWRARPAIALCGHIHASRGQEWLQFDRAQGWYEAIMLCQKPWLNVFLLAVYVAWIAMMRAIGSASKARSAGNMGTHLVNAAVVGGRGNSEHRDPIVLTM